MLISHRMPDVFSVCDRVIVMRRGDKVADKPIHAVEPRGSHRADHRREGGGVMAMPLESPDHASPMSAATSWWRRGFFASPDRLCRCSRSSCCMVVMHFASPDFFTAGNMQNVAKNFSFIAIATLGVTFVIVTGGIDLSVGSMMCFSAMITSIVMQSCRRRHPALAVRAYGR